MAHWQLVGLGFGAGAIKHRVRVGKLHRLYRGVYAVGHDRVSLHGRWWAAVLSYGQHAVLSHRDAAALWGIRPSSRPSIDVTVPGRSRRRQRGITLHLVRRLHRDDVTHCHGIPVTSVARTLLDLAEVVSFRQFERALEESERLRLFDLKAVDELRARSRGRRGLAPLARALRNVRAPTGVIRSELERDFLALLDRAGIPRPATNLFVEGFEVDGVWMDERVVVELDSREFHLTRAAFEADRRRDAALQAAGFGVLRVTHQWLHGDPEHLLSTTRSLLLR